MIILLFIHGLYFDISLIEILKKENLNSFLIYASDHGESFGGKWFISCMEFQYRFAPKEQTHIPFFLWYSEQL